MTHRRVLKKGEKDLGNVAKDGKRCHLVRLEMRWEVMESVSGVTFISISTIGKNKSLVCSRNEGEWNDMF